MAGLRGLGLGSVAASVAFIVALLALANLALLPPDGTLGNEGVEPHLGNAAEAPHCHVVLPPLPHHWTPSELLSRAQAVLEGEDSIFPFTTEAGYNISGADAKAVDVAVHDRADKQEKMPICMPSTYDGHSVHSLGVALGVTGDGLKPLQLEDVVVDLGAGIGKILAVAALTTNASARGIELSKERHEEGCRVLQLLRQVLSAGGDYAAPSRRFELFQGDIFDAPAALVRPTAGAMNFIAYANCLPYGLLAAMMKIVATAPATCVRLFTTKEPVSVAPQSLGLHRHPGLHGGLYTLFSRLGDACSDAVAKS